jgi:predicted  nucleic acid-binding Zn-ribbon protein
MKELNCDKVEKKTVKAFKKVKEDIEFLKKRHLYLQNELEKIKSKCFDSKKAEILFNEFENRLRNIEERLDVEYDENKSHSFIKWFLFGDESLDTIKEVGKKW